MAQIWYPADQTVESPRAAYIPDADAVGPALARFLGVPDSALRPLRSISTNAVDRAPVAARERTYPVLVMLVGIKGSYRQIQTFQAEELASHGYVVAALDQPYSVALVVFPDGRQVAYDDRWRPSRSTFMDIHIPYLADDVRFTLDQLESLERASNDRFTGRLDLQRVGLVGHSFGAVVGAQACHLDRRIRAGLLEDAFMPADVVRAGLQQPMMFLTRDADSMRRERRDAGGWPETDIRETLDTMRAVYERLPGDGYYVQVPGMFHLDMTDAPFLTSLVSWPGLTGPIGGTRAHRIVNAYSVAFFDHELRGRAAPLLDGPSDRFPEVIFERRRTTTEASSRDAT
jgi:predicted dienelactone hydrolase